MPNDDREQVFKEIRDVSEYLGLDESVVEKDLYVTQAIKYLR